ncbi:hypothetical protein BC941DRAFT_347368 [Chlamydoabsidia padenii]|nr:hypothetical protein BC941DRAFT_347368 [Chlamydoabsidia padenii]
MDEDFAEETTSLNKTFTSGASSSNSTTVALTTEPSPRIKMAGEDVFTEACVKTWQSSRIKAWESRYLSPETYYYRFVTPGEGQQMGAWSPKEHKLFMDRYEEWISNGWKIGASWGLFSTSIPHRVGYQCMNYYRKLVEKKKLEDPSYELVDGKLKQTKRQDAPGNDSNIPTSELGPDWEREDVKQLEKNVDSWLKQYHKRSGW